MNNKSERRMTVHERIAKHRAAHPRDKASFGEERLPQKKKVLNRESEKTKPEKPHAQTESAAKDVKPLIQHSRNQLPINMRRCKKCGTETNAHRVRTGDCHTDSYGKGYRGQDGYSGNSGRGRLHGN